MRPHYIIAAVCSLGLFLTWRHWPIVFTFDVLLRLGLGFRVDRRLLFLGRGRDDTFLELNKLAQLNFVLLGEEVHVVAGALVDRPLEDKEAAKNVELVPTVPANDSPAVHHEEEAEVTEEKDDLDRDVASYRLEAILLGFVAQESSED